ncbi:related to integral membrane protein PTH11, partial [Phialocephala subalpina]
ACILATSVWWFTQCNPVARGWGRTIEGTCAPISVLAILGYLTSAYSAFLDIFFALYPIPFIMQLNMPLKSRIAVSTALSLSVLACIVSIYKLAIFGQVFEILATDPTYLVPYLNILGVSEGVILLICSSLPTLGALFRLARGKLTSTGGSRNVPNQSAASNQGRSGGMGNSSRANYQGHKLEDPENGSTRTAGVQSSVDDVPLVSTSKTIVTISRPEPEQEDEIHVHN